MTSYMDYTSPHTQFTYDLSHNNVFKKDAANFINELSIKQLNTLENTSLLDIFLSKSNVVEPHYHQNAAELVYCICGSAVVSILNPFTKELLNFPICPGQVANVPQGWWHYEIATVDNTHLLAIFDAPIPEVIYGSDILRLTPDNVLAHTYCLDEAKVCNTLSPITQTTVIGPPANCCEPGKVQGATAAMPQPQPYSYPQANQGYAYPQMNQGYGYRPQTVQGYYSQGYVQQFQQPPYTQQQPYIQQQPYSQSSALPE